MGFVADDTAREVVLRSRGLAGNCRVFENTLYFVIHGHEISASFFFFCFFFLLFFFPLLRRPYDCQFFLRKMGCVLFSITRCHEVQLVRMMWLKM